MNLVIKGTPEQALQAAQQRSIEARVIKHLPFFCQTVLEATNPGPQVELAAAYWLAETKLSDCVEGVGYPSGTLLHYR